MRRTLQSVAALCLVSLAWARPAEDALVQAGRAVYLAEGCINCHSQYVRPATPEIQRWGPASPLAATLAQTPPLLGNRRQGPDLQNVGNRRSHEWQRLHLIAPRKITPGSRMPAYAYLFAQDDTRGEALLAYLDSLGAGKVAAQITWIPPENGVAIDRSAQHRLFAQWCASCHGESGRGDGALASSLTPRPRDLEAERWHYVAPAGSPTAERAALARLIKFGVPGTATAGREYLSDADVATLASYVQSLRGRPERIPTQL